MPTYVVLIVGLAVPIGALLLYLLWWNRYDIENELTYRHLQSVEDERDWIVYNHPNATSESCCDLHGRNCEPPGDLCCEECTEAVHQLGDAATGNHLADGSICSNPDLSGTRGMKNA